MKALTFTATFLGLFFGVIASGVTVADARPGCRPGQVYRPSVRVCVPKRSAIKAGVYKRRKVSIRHRYKRPPVNRSHVQKMQIASPLPPRNPIPSLRCDELCQLKINLHAWAQRNRENFQ